MISVLLVAHGQLGEALIQCATHVLGARPEGVAAVSVRAGDDPDAVQGQAEAVLARLDSGSGVLVLTDMVGATPSNIATRLAVPGHVCVVAGVNLPMLVRVLTYRDRTLETLVAKAVSGGAEGVVCIQPRENHAASGS